MPEHENPSLIQKNTDLLAKLLEKQAKEPQPKSKPKGKDGTVPHGKLVLPPEATNPDA